MMKRLKRYVPPGGDGSGELILYGIGFLFAFIWSLCIASSFNWYLTTLFRGEEVTGLSMVGINMMVVEVPRNLMPDFLLIIQGTGFGFRLLFLYVLLLALTYRGSFRQGSKSIYLMKRLPDRKEYWRRVLGLPLILFAFTLIAHLILILIYFGLYMLITPDEYLQPMQWQKLWANPWRVLLCLH